MQRKVVVRRGTQWRAHALYLQLSISPPPDRKKVPRNSEKERFIIPLVEKIHDLSHGDIKRLVRLCFPLAGRAAPVEAVHVSVLMENRRKWITATACCLAVLSLASVKVPAQAPPTLPGVGKKEAPATAEDPLPKIVNRAKAAMADFDGEENDSPLPADITPAEKESRYRQLEETVLTGGRALKVRSSLEDARKAAESSKETAAEWKNFDGGPPRSLLVVDGLMDERDALREVLASQWSALANYRNLLEPAQQEARAADQKERDIFQNADTGEAGKWRYDAAKEAAALLATRVLLLQGNVDLYQARIDAGNAEVSLLDRKIALATKQAAPSDDDLKKIQAVVDSRKAELSKTAADASKRLKAMLVRRTAAQKQSTAIQAAETDETKAAQSLAKATLESTTAQVDLLERIRDTAQIMIPVQNEWTDAYRNRYAVLRGTAGELKEKAVTSLRAMADRLTAWERVADDELAGGTAELSRVDSQMAALPRDDARYSVMAERRALVNERTEQLKRTLGMIISMRRLLTRWVTDFSDPAANSNITGHVKVAWSTVWGKFLNVWNFEITGFDTSRMIGGVLVPGRDSVTVGMVAKAILFFLIAYFIAVKIADRVQAGVVRRAHMPEAFVRTLRNWAMIAVCAVLAVATLSILRIPLTVFAFFGGALAIGLGFALQNLIKNFISGIILLVERKVRVGDVVDVNGVQGTVVEVNARSSVIKSSDETETMIPNSVFFENRVANLTLSNSRVRKTIRVRVDYENDAQGIPALMKREAARHGNVLDNPEPYVALDDISDGALVFVLYYWIDVRQASNLVVSNDLRQMIIKKFAETGVAMPRNQQEVTLTRTPAAALTTNPPHRLP